MSTTRGAPSWAVAARDLFLVAMAVFVLNIGIGAPPVMGVTLLVALALLAMRAVSASMSSAGSERLSTPEGMCGWASPVSAGLMPLPRP